MPTLPRLRLSLAILMVAVTAACQSQAPTAEATPSLSDLPTAQPSASATTIPTASPSPVPTVDSDLTRRPFTVLLLGADLQGRTDVVMVAGLDVASKTLSLASIPRDTINVPMPGGGTYTNQKINAFYNYAADHPTLYPQGPARATADMVGLLLGIEIDFYARTTFGGFSALTEAIGGVTITLQKKVSDPYYQITTTKIGISFPAGTQTLDGDRALIFVRTRQGDNDFERQRRQQAFLLAAGRQLLANPALFAALLDAQRNLQSDFPVTQVPALLLAIGNVEDWKINQAVLGPERYESAASCPCGYALAPKLAEFAKLGALYYPWAVRR